MFNTNTIISSHGAVVGVLHQQHRCIMIGLLLVTIACQPKLHQQASSKEKSPEQITRHELAFISFKITKDNSGKTGVSVINIIKTEGIVADVPYQTREQNVLTITLLDNDKKELSSKTIEHPLVKDVEVTTENGTFERKSVSLNEAEFFVRMGFKPQTSYIRIDEVINGVKTEIAVLSFQAK